MKKLLLSVLLGIAIVSFSAYNSTAQTINFNIIIDKPSFLRYEIVSFKANLTQDGNPISDATLTARFYNSTGNLITTVGNIQSVNLYYNSTDKLWYGHWPIPWNPNLGIYTVNVTANVSGVLYTQSSQLNITMRKPKKILPPGYLAVLAEDSGSVKDTATSITGPYNESANWLNMYKWAEFMGADSFWPTAGYITGYLYGEANQSFPWYYPSYKDFREVCQVANQSGLSCGAWIWPYNIFEPKEAESRYNITFIWALTYDCDTGNVVNATGHVSILDERAINHTVKMIQMLSSSEYVTTIGIDWEPPWTADLRLVNDEFVRKMNVEVPPDWYSYTQEEKMKWVGKKLLSGGYCSANLTIWDKWLKWMLYNYAKTLEEIFEKANSPKSFFMFSGVADPWRSGHVGHPTMANDAGVDIIAPMLYVAPARAGRNGTGCWYEGGIDYFKREVTFEKLPNVVGGQIVMDSAYINCTYGKDRWYPSPEEMYDRMMMSGKMHKDGTISGLFWHDILRAFAIGWRAGLPIPYSAMEWAIGGGAAASDLRLEAGRIPINMSIEAPDKIYYIDTLTGNITVTNLGNTSLDVTVYLVNNTPGWDFVTQIFTTINLAPSQTKKMPFIIKSNLRNYGVDNRFMIAAKAKWGNKPQDTHLEFKYVHAYPKSIFSGKLKNLTDNPVRADVIIYQQETGKIISSNKTDSQGNYYFFIPAGTYDIQFNLTDFPIQNYYIKLKSVDMSFDVSDLIKHITYDSSKNKVIITLEIEKTRTIQINSPLKPNKILKNSTVIENVSSLSELKTNKWFYDETEQKIYLILNRFLIGFEPLFGYWEIGVGDHGYYPYIYTAGPYDVNQTVTVSSIYLYTMTAGKAKVALYDAIYNEDQYLTKHNPNNLIVQSGEVTCPANEWCYFDIPDTQIPAGKYFLTVKINTDLMLSGISRSGFGQFRTHSYVDPFPNPFGTVPGHTGAEYSIYACCS